MISPKTSGAIASLCEGNWLNDTAAEGACGLSEGADAPAAPTKSCLGNLIKMCKEVGDGEFNVYNMYDTCFPNNGVVKGATGLAELRGTPLTHPMPFRHTPSLWPRTLSLATHPLFGHAPSLSPRTLSLAFLPFRSLDPHFLFKLNGTERRGARGGYLWARE